MQSITLIAPDISCDHCRRTIEQEVGSMDGILSVSVDVPAREVNVSYDPDRTSPGEIIRRLDEEGYPVTG